MGRAKHPKTKREILKSIEENLPTLKKEIVLTPYALSKIAEKDIRTIRSHIPGLIGEKVNGKEIRERRCDPCLVVDDPNYTEPSYSEKEIYDDKPAMPMKSPKKLIIEATMKLEEGIDNLFENYGLISPRKFLPFPIMQEIISVGLEAVTLLFPFPSFQKNET
jgi:hypothetical protein